VIKMPDLETEEKEGIKVDLHQVLGAALKKLALDHKVTLTYDEILSMDRNHLRLVDGGDERTLEIAVQEDADFLISEGERLIAKGKALKPQASELKPQKVKR